MSDLLKEPPFEETVEAICDEIRNHLKPSRSYKHIKITVEWEAGNLPALSVETDAFKYVYVNGESEDK